MCRLSQYPRVSNCVSTLNLTLTHYFILADILILFRFYVTGGDRGVASKEKRKHKKKKAASTDVLHQELLENDAPKVGESNLMLEKEACEETDNASFRKNAG